MSDEAKKQPEVNKVDSTDIPLPEEDDFALAALDFLSEALGGDTSPVDTGSVPDDFFDTGQLSSMAALNWQAKETTSKSVGETDADAALHALASEKTGIDETNLMDLVESLTAPEQEATPTDNTLIDLAESMTNPALDKDKSEDSALMDLVESLTNPVPDEPSSKSADSKLADDPFTLPDLTDTTLDEETLILGLAESVSDDMLLSAEDAFAQFNADEDAPTADDLFADDLMGLAELANIPQLGVEDKQPAEEIAPPAAEDDNKALASLETNLVADLMALAESQSGADGGSSDIDAELAVLAALEASGGDLDIDAALAALAEAEHSGRPAIESAESAGDAELAMLAALEESGDDELDINAALDALVAESEVSEQPIVDPVAPVLEAEDEALPETVGETIDLPNFDELMGNDALDLLDEPTNVFDLLDDEPIDIMSLAEDALAVIDEIDDDDADLLQIDRVDDSVLMAEDALAVLDGENEDVLALDLLESRDDEEEITSDYLDQLVASIDAQLISTQKQETLLDLSNEAETRGTILEQLIVFTIGGAQYAIPIENVVEVGEPPIATPVPFVPPWVRGVFNMRGDILSLVDLRVYFELGSQTGEREEWMIVSQTNREDMTVGLLVDDIIGNRQMGAQDAVDLTFALDGVLTEYVARIYRQNDELISVLDFNKLLNSAEMRQFELA